MSVRCGYCGPGNVVPPGYDYLENRNVCLRKGFGGGSANEKRKWQRKLGLRIDPPYVSPCPKSDRNLVRQVRRANRRRSPRRSPSPRISPRNRSRTPRRSPRSRSLTPRRIRSRTPIRR